MVPSELSKKGKVYYVVKSILDFLLALILIISLSWLLIILAIITKLTSKGPIFYKQERQGRNQKPFNILKFRSLKTDAPNIAPGTEGYNDIELYFTKWGRFMRIIGLDELPQLFNILKGQMSFIGPRPNQNYENEKELIDERLAISPSPYLVRPGIMGYAIVKMGREVDFKRKAQYDSYYVEHFGLFIDLKILLLSIGLFRRLFRKKK